MSAMIIAILITDSSVSIVVIFLSSFGIFILDPQDHYTLLWLIVKKIIYFFLSFICGFGVTLCNLWLDISLDFPLDLELDLASDFAFVSTLGPTLDLSLDYVFDPSLDHALDFPVVSMLEATFYYMFVYTLDSPI
jgi:hypothetical protein